MTIAERVKMALECADYNNEDSSIEKVIAMAYYMGRESATKELCDKHNAIINGMRDRADECRYYLMAHSIIGDDTRLVSADYAGEMTLSYGDDKADI